MTASSVALSFPDSCPILGKMFTGYGDFFKQFGSSVALDNADLDNAGHDYVNTSGLPLASSRRTGGPGKPLGIPLAPLDQPLLNEPLPCGGYRLIPDTFAPGISDEWWCYTANPFFTFAGRQVQSFSAPEPCQLQAMYNPTTCASTKLMFRLHNEVSPGTYTVDVYLALLTSRGQFLGNGVGFGAPLLAYGPAAQLYGAPAPSVTFVAGGVPPEASFTWVMPDRLVDSSTDLVRYPTIDEVRATTFEVDFTVNGSAIQACDPSLAYAWRIDDQLVSLVKKGNTGCVWATNLSQGPHSVALSTDGGTNFGQAMTIKVKDWLVVSLGDSVGSGEGAPDLPRDAERPPAGRSTVQWEDGACDRSANAASARAAIQIEKNDPHTSVTFVHLACSGAGILDPYLRDGPDGVMVNRLLDSVAFDEMCQTQPDQTQVCDQVEHLRQLIGYRPIDALLINIGANDVYFGPTLKYCFQHADCNTIPVKLNPDPLAEAFTMDAAGEPLGDIIDQQLEQLPHRYQVLAEHLADSFDPNQLPPNHVYLVEYYNPTEYVTPSGDLDYCPSMGTPTDIAHIPPLVMSHEAWTWAGSTMLQGLNAAVANAAIANQWNFIGNVANRYGPHGYCADDTWIVSYDVSQQIEIQDRGTGHPNYKGQNATGAIEAQALTDALYDGGDPANGPKAEYLSTP